MENFKSYFFKNFEQFFVLIILITIALINYFIPQKLAFLNFYFLPIILAGYYLGSHKSVMGALLCIVLMFTYSFLFTDQFIVPMSPSDVYFHILVWGGFLIISGGIIGNLHDRLRKEITLTRSLEKTQTEQSIELEVATQTLMEHSEKIESKVIERTKVLEKSKDNIEQMKTRLERTLHSVIDPTIARLITEGKIKNEFKKISLINIDFSDYFTKKLEGEPGHIINDLNSHFSQIDKIVLQYKGHIDKLSGHSITATFGTTYKLKNHRLLASLCALRLLDKARSFTFDMKISIISDTVLTGLIGNPKTFSPLGNIVLASNKLLESCPKNEIIIDKNTHDEINRFFEVSPFKTESLNNIFLLKKLKNYYETKKILPKTLCESFQKYEKLISFPEDLILPIEAIEGKLGYSKIVSALSYALANKMNLSELEKQEILYAAYISDIGKETIPPEILDNFDNLNEAEKNEYEKHPLEAPNILRNLGYSSEFMFELIRKCNERSDGSGFPNKLNNDDLPFGAQIISTCKTFCSLEEKIGKTNALLELKIKGQDGIFNPEIVSQLYELLA